MVGIDRLITSSRPSLIQPLPAADPARIQSMPGGLMAAIGVAVGLPSALNVMRLCIVDALAGR